MIGYDSFINQSAGHTVHLSGSSFIQPRCINDIPTIPNANNIFYISCDTTQRRVLYGSHRRSSRTRITQLIDRGNLHAIYHGDTCTRSNTVFCNHRNLHIARKNTCLVIIAHISLVPRILFGSGENDIAIEINGFIRTVGKKSVRSSYV